MSEQENQESPEKIVKISTRKQSNFALFFGFFLILIGGTGVAIALILQDKGFESWLCLICGILGFVFLIASVVWFIVKYKTILSYDINNMLIKLAEKAKTSQVKKIAAAVSVESFSKNANTFGFRNISQNMFVARRGGFWSKRCHFVIYFSTVGTIDESREKFAAELEKTSENNISPSVTKMFFILIKANKDTDIETALKENIPQTNAVPHLAMFVSYLLYKDGENALYYSDFTIKKALTFIKQELPYCFNN